MTFVYGITLLISCDLWFPLLWREGGLRLTTTLAVCVKNSCMCIPPELVHTVSRAGGRWLKNSVTIFFVLGAFSTEKRYRPCLCYEDAKEEGHDGERAGNTSELLFK